MGHFWQNLQVLKPKILNCEPNTMRRKCPKLTVSARSHDHWPYFEPEVSTSVHHQSLFCQKLRCWHSEMKKKKLRLQLKFKSSITFLRGLLIWKAEIWPESNVVTVICFYLPHICTPIVFHAGTGNHRTHMMYFASGNFYLRARPSTP